MWLPGGAGVCAETPASGMSAGSSQDVQAHVQSLRALALACRADATACDVAKAGADDRVIVKDDADASFQVRWTWLRESLEEAKKGTVEQRAALMDAAAARLEEMSRPAPRLGKQEFAKARAATDRILAGAEFGRVEEPSWLDRKIAGFWLWFNKLWAGAAKLGAVGPWLGQLMEWMFFGGAAVGLLLYVRRNLQRQRLAVALNQRGSELAWTREATDWAAQAETSAHNGDWRDAVHCLYWATIVMLEGRRAWRHNPARTPREYVKLLKPGSVQQKSLRGLTQIFERLWYGLRSAGPADYEKARTLYEALRSDSAAGVA